jgi:aspartyl-tRNA(Asn)/glutamyl-tRNA(Gln) amidotransferase subunit A
MIPYTLHRQVLDRGETTSTAAVRAALDRAEAVRGTNAIIELFRGDACTEAQRCDARFPTARARALEGCTIVVKDNISIAGKALTCASRVLQGFEAVYDATVVARLRNAGAILLGRGNMDEFAMGSSGEYSCYGPVLHPLDAGCVAGGSSGGPAAAVATGLAMAAIGSDTGGSVRLPAAYCGVVGFKPGYGVLSRRGLVSFAPSCDHIGLLARSVDDIALLLRVLGGSDAGDSTSVATPACDSARPADNTKPRIGFLHEYADMDPAVRHAFASLRVDCEQSDWPVADVSLAHARYALPSYVVISMAEASSNLARYDGVRFGRQVPGGEDYGTWIARNRSAGFGREVRRRILLGSFVLSHGYADRYYAKAQSVRQSLCEDFRRTFKDVDVIATPTTLTTAFKLGERLDDPVRMYQSDLCTVPANLAGIPAISIPYGADQQGMPIGMQLMANRGQEHMLLNVARFVERRAQERR